ncbi:Pex12 amino terminal region-domain-containing protein, partial [Filobasidium floriforme]|uniref:Pex12 amino terminal region-domain-containing protein n=1 Tax=Filobasidium floriforme TaxID=5210 RepID=UPI001E8CB954
MSSLLQHLHEHEANEPASADRPSIYELLATDELRDLVQPAFRYVLAFFAQRYPRYLLRLVNRHEEVYALFMLLVEGYHLRRLDSTFADQFYGMRYRSSLPDRPSARPSSRQKALILAFIVGIPYVKAKMKDLYERLGGGLDPEIARARRENDPRGSIISTRSRLKNLIMKLFKLIYPYAALGYALLEVGYDVNYAFAARGEWRWWMKFVRVSGIRDDGSLSESEPSSTATTLLASLPRHALSNLFPLTLLALKFSQWWYSPNSPRASHAEESSPGDRVRVPPPGMLRPAERGISSSSSEPSLPSTPPEFVDGSEASTERKKPLAYGHCPICEEPWSNPTALPTGYVGCYLCLYRFVEREGVCPVTGGDLAGMGGVDSLRKVL